jgi:O-acetyl-ADP-ribose deacetylase (regulator of RNase III)
MKKEPIEGNLLELAKEGKFDVIVQGCNCFNIMGAGIALQIAEQFPEAYLADQKTNKGDYRKLGSFSFATIGGFTRPFIIVNAYTQFKPGVGPYDENVAVDYNALEVCFRTINHEFGVRYKSKDIPILERVSHLAEPLHIAYPQIGAGLAGGDWDHIETLIDRSLTDVDHTLVTFSGWTKVI